MTLTVKKNSQDKIVASIIFKHGDVTTVVCPTRNGLSFTFLDALLAS